MNEIKFIKNEKSITRMEYTFGWIGNPYREGAAQTRLEAILDKISNYAVWRDYLQKNGAKKFWRHVKEVFTIDETGLHLLKNELDIRKERQNDL